MILVKNLKSLFCKLGLEIMFDDLVRKQVLLDYLNTNIILQTAISYSVSLSTFQIFGQSVS